VQESYDEAAVRHWEDATLLREGRRFPNADQLAGLAAECAIKAAMVLLPHFRGPDGRLQETYHQHVDVLWDRVPVQGGIHKRFPGLVAVLCTPNPFQDFALIQRYWPATAIGEEAAKRHLSWARRVLGAVQLLGQVGAGP